MVHSVNTQKTVCCSCCVVRRLAWLNRTMGKHAVSMRQNDTGRVVSVATTTSSRSSMNLLFQNGFFFGIWIRSVRDDFNTPLSPIYINQTTDELHNIWQKFFGLTKNRIDEQPSPQWTIHVALRVKGKKTLNLSQLCLTTYKCRVKSNWNDLVFILHLLDVKWPTITGLGLSAALSWNANREYVHSAVVFSSV